MDESQLRELFEVARQEGLARYAGNKAMERKLRRAGTVGHKAYLRVLPEFQPGDGCLVTLAFRSPTSWGYEAHSVGLVKDAPLGAWAVTALAVTPVRLEVRHASSSGK